MKNSFDLVESLKGSQGLPQGPSHDTVENHLIK